jgi:NADH-quinone oxidoreductase subunit H
MCEIIYLFFFFFKFLSILIPLLLAIAYLTLLERKIMGAIQRRKGPNVVGFFGLLQPLADGLKLFLKETIIPIFSNNFIFFLSPIISFTLSILSWMVIPLSINNYFLNINLGILYVFAISSLSVYGIIMSGWSSNSKYAFLGSLRSAAQMISYEVSLGIIIIVVIICSNSLNLKYIVLSQLNIWYIIPLLPCFIMFFISCLAETNRSPFDLPEAEAELVSGYNTEYSAMGFALFFLAEYSNMILMSSFSVVLFLGGWLSPFNIFLYNKLDNMVAPIWFSLKVIILLFLFVWIRVSLPRYRYDQLMLLGWKSILPFSLSYLILISSILINFEIF